MRTHGLPDDVFQNVSALTVIIPMPVMQQLVYPALQQLKIPYPPISRITADFYLQAAAMAYASGVQKMIYSAGSCYEAPLKCQLTSNGAIPNRVSVVLQVPACVLDGLAGTLYHPTGQQYAYTKAASSMRSFVQVVLMFTVTSGGALAIASSPLYKDPTNMSLYTSLAGVMFLFDCLFLVSFKKYNLKKTT
jgi:POT family proton-dependent oligopeptide transporter